MNFHCPVMPEESIDALRINPQGTYLDGTLGGGGHFQRLIYCLSGKGTAIGIDRDPEAVNHAQRTIDCRNVRVLIAHTMFSQFEGVLANHGIEWLDGILLDLGVSSHQIDSPQRGFSYQHDAPLDMRMDPASPRTAAHVIQESTEEQLENILREFGEVQNPARLARTLKKAVKENPLVTSNGLRECLHEEYGPVLNYKLLAKLFQALRIAVNDELGELKTFLDKTERFLRTGGRLVLISYHSLEDRMVKNFFREKESPCVCPPQMPRCVCGRQASFKRVNRRAIKPAPSEIEKNVRARSARMRVGERL